MCLQKTVPKISFVILESNDVIAEYSFSNCFGERLRIVDSNLLALLPGISM